VASTPDTVASSDGWIWRCTRASGLTSGAEVGVYEFGDPDGLPVIAFHGTPVCGAGFLFADEAARLRGIRLLAPDRPGVGLSTPLAGWTVGSYGAQVGRVADACGVERFAVWGYSGGGPYAVACAAALPDRVTRVAVAAGMGEIGEWASREDFEKTDRMMLKLSQRRPMLARTVMAISGRWARLSPKSAAKSFAKELSPSDQAVLAASDPGEFMAMFTNAVLRGARGVVDDYRALGQSWGVDPGSISAPVKIFQGESDTMVPLRHAEELARRIPGSELSTWPGEGHLGTVTHVDEILEWLSQPLRSST
jgi:pimeloyl-ACP methyl ester carboxylesterase